MTVPLLQATRAMGGLEAFLQAASTPEEARPCQDTAEHDIGTATLLDLNYHQSTSTVHAQVLQNLILCCRRLGPGWTGSTSIRRTQQFASAPEEARPCQDTANHDKGQNQTVQSSKVKESKAK